MKRILQIFTDLKFALFILFLIAMTSSLGSVIEQDQTLEYYQLNYPLTHPIYGFLDWKFILFFGFDHLYKTVWFFGLLFILSISLISCTLVRQFPLFFNSKEYFFKKQKVSFSKLPFFISFPKRFYNQEIFLSKLQDLQFYIFQKQDVFYGYKGLIGRISPVLVHLSLLFILAGSFFGAFQNLKAQEIIAKGEIFHVQNPIQTGPFTPLPNISLRVNDFWVEYEKNRIHQFYSNLSILDPFGVEVQQQTISVNNPLRFQGFDFYQSDWNLLGIRIENQKQIYELPLFPFPKTSKAWVTWIPNVEQNFICVFDQFENFFSVYDKNGAFIGFHDVGEWMNSEDLSIRILEILPSTGLLLKYDPSIGFIYLGFGLLMITTCFSYLPYTQIWLFQQQNQIWIGSNTNRGKIQLEIQFENLIRFVQNSRFKRETLLREGGQ